MKRFLICIALAGNLSATTYFWGDSLTWGVDGDGAQTRVTKPWPALFCQPSEVCVNYGIPGATARGIVYAGSGPIGSSTPGIYQQVVLPGDTNVLTIGTNEMRSHGGSTAAALEEYQTAHLADAAFLAIPDAMKINPRANKGVKFTGTWAVDSAVYARYGSATNTPGATAAFTGSGDTLVLGFTRFAVSQCSWTVIIDGRVSRTISCQSVQTPVFQDTFEANGFLFSGLGPGAHTVILTLATSGDTGFWDWAAFISQPVVAPHLYVGAVQRQRTDAYASCAGGGTAVCSDVGTQAFNSVAKYNVAQLAAAGLNVTFVDTFNFVDPLVDLGADGEHQNQAGYVRLAAVWTACLLNVTQSCMGDLTIFPVILATGPAGIVELSYNWFGGPTLTPQTVFLHLLDSTGALVFTEDIATDAPTTAWSGITSFQRPLKVSLPSGVYGIDVGLYKDDSRVNLTAAPGAYDDGSWSYRVGTLQVK